MTTKLTLTEDEIRAAIASYLQREITAIRFTRNEYDRSPGLYYYQVEVTVK